jgi:2-haloacid dehalogenase
MSDRWATFDCYGTLIDWNGGIRRELARIFGEDNADGLLARYHEVEPEIQAADPELPYREVMARSLERLDAPAEERGALGSSLPSWEPFPEVPAALEEAKARGWKLAILSNTDRDFIGASKARLGIPFDETIVASEIGSYKPGHRHWSEFFARRMPTATATSTWVRAISMTSPPRTSLVSPASGSTVLERAATRRRHASFPT